MKRAKEYRRWGRLTANLDSWDVCFSVARNGTDLMKGGMARAIWGFMGLVSFVDKRQGDLLERAMRRCERGRSDGAKRRAIRWVEK